MEGKNLMTAKSSIAQKESGIRAVPEAREKLANVLEESKTEEVVIRRRKGDIYAIIPQPPRPRRSPFDVPSLSKGFTNQEIVEAIRESRERA